MNSPGRTGAVVTGAFVLVLAGAAGGWLVKGRREAAGGLPDPRLAEIQSAIAATRAETEAWKRRATGAPEPKAAPVPSEVRIPLPAGTLAERLDHYHALLRKNDEECRGLASKSPEERKAVWDRQARILLEAQHELHPEVLKEPGAFLAALRSETDPRALAFLLQVLNPADLPTGTMWSCPSYSDYPAELRAGLQALLVAGAPSQKVAVVNTMAGMSSLPADTLHLIESMLRDADERVAVKALSVISRGSDHRLPERLRSEAEALAARATDPEALESVCYLLGQIATPPMQDAWIDQLASSADFRALAALRAGLDTMPEERMSRFVVALRAAAERTQDAGRFRSMLSTAIRLRAPDRLQLLEGLQGRAPTAALNAALDEIVGMLRDGETRSDQLRAPIYR